MNSYQSLQGHNLNIKLTILYTGKYIFMHEIIESINEKKKRKIYFLKK